MFDFLGLKKGIADIQKQVSSLQEKIELFKRERDDLLALPLPQEDVANALAESVDELADGFVEKLQNVVFNVHRLDRHPNLSAASTLQMATRENFSKADLGVGLAFLCCMDPDKLKTAIHQNVMRLNWPEKVGPPRAERAARLTEINNEITTLETEEQAILKTAKDSGISIAQRITE